MMNTSRQPMAHGRCSGFSLKFASSLWTRCHQNPSFPDVSLLGTPVHMFHSTVSFNYCLLSPEWFTSTSNRCSFISRLQQTKWKKLVNDLVKIVSLVQKNIFLNALSAQKIFANCFCQHDAHYKIHLHLFHECVLIFCSPLIKYASPFCSLRLLSLKK